MNYLRITGISRTIATRDLQGLMEIKALFRIGTLKSARCHLCTAG